MVIDITNGAARQKQADVIMCLLSKDLLHIVLLPSD